MASATGRLELRSIYGDGGDGSQSTGDELVADWIG